jgi:hypothetical protein
MPARCVTNLVLSIDYVKNEEDRLKKKKEQYLKRRNSQKHLLSTP